MNNEVIAGGTVGTFIAAIGVGLSVPGLTQILSLVATALSIIITIISGVILPLIKWYKKAKEDGKITAEEIGEAQKILDESAEKLTEVVKTVENAENKDISKK